MLQMTRDLMKTRFGGLLFLCVLTLLSIGLVACSSSDDDDNGGTNNPAGVNLLTGTYFMGIFADSGSSSMWNQINDTEFDGQDTYDNTIEYDSDGDSGINTGAYTVGSDGAIAFTGTDIAGISSSDGAFFSIIDTNPTEDILLGVGVQVSSGMTAANLIGTYVVGQVRHDLDRVKTSRMEFTFNGAGSFVGDIQADSDDTPSALSGTYTVADDGGLDITVTGLPKDLEGQVSADGNLFVILDTDDDDEVSLMVGLKTTTGADVSLLSGNYQMSQFGGDATANWTTQIDMTADGSGNITATISADSGGDLTAPPAMTYTVGADGTLGITGLDEAGIVSSDGNTFILMDAVSSDDDVTFTIGVKKS